MILAAGAAGNGVAAIVWERGIPNPLVMDIGQAVIAFNLADIFTLVGVLLLMVELSSVTIRNRNQLLPPRQFARMLWQRVSAVVSASHAESVRSRKPPCTRTRR